jgi:hypothetical protein
MEIFFPAAGKVAAQKKRGRCVIRCTGKHADLIENKIKTFALRYDEPTHPSLEAGKFLTIIRCEHGFRNQRVIAKDEVLLKSIAPFYLDKHGMTVGYTKRILTEKELHELAHIDGFGGWEEMAMYYLTRRTAYHFAHKGRPRESFSGIMITWEWRPDLRDIVFETRGVSERKAPIPRGEWQRLRREAEMTVG